MRLTLRRARLLAVLMPLVLLAACGAAESEELVFGMPHVLDGDYGFFAWQGVDGVANADGALASWGPIQADGRGGLTGAYDQNAGGNVGGPIPFADPSRYAIDNHHVLRALFGTTSVWDGGASGDGSLAVAAITSTVGVPGMFVLAKRSGSFSDASLDGVYHLGLISVGRTTGAAATWVAAAATFDGTGRVVTAYSRNVEGTLAMGLGDAGTYAIQPDGSLRWVFGFGASGTGLVLAGGGLVLLTGATNAPNDPFFAVLVRAGTAVEASAFRGTYHAVGFERDDVGGFLSSHGALQANGISGVASALVKNNGSRLTTPPIGTAGFVVAADGALSLDDGETRAGAIATDGAYGFVTGPTGIGTNPAFTFFVR